MLAKRIHQINLEKGFYNPPASRARRWMLIASELFEAIEGLRENNFNPSLDESRETIKASCACEMADAYIRLVDFAEYEELEAQSNEFYLQLYNDPAEEIFKISIGVHMAWELQKVEEFIGPIKSSIEVFCKRHSIDLMAFVEWKLEYNSKREYKHGKEW